MLTPLDLRGVPHDRLGDRLPRPVLDADEPVAAVREILTLVREGGDEAVRDLTERFDGVRPGDLRVDPAEVAEAPDRIDASVRSALRAACGAIDDFHRAQLRPRHTYERDGVRVDGEFRPVDRAGLYVPGGLAAYPSTVLMTAVPARVAGVPEIVLCVPPGPDGHVAPVTLAAAAIAGADEVYAVGGAQAIAAMAFGTESVRAVDAIGGPGNVYVAIAKREVAGRVAVPAAFAGPSEVVVVADASAPVDFAAIDLLVQAEHGPNGLAWLVTWEQEVADEIAAAVARLVEQAPRRGEIEATLAEGGHVVLVDDAAAAIAVANLIAPEHLELMCEDPHSLIPLVRHAGAVFCGPWAPASIGDYIAGPSHVLPTFGSARFASALTVDDFLKQVHVVTLDRAAFDGVAPVVQTLAEAEGLDAHAESIRLRARSGSDA